MAPTFTQLDINTNIMLDLKIAPLDPTIIQIGAVHFNLNTGTEHNNFTRLVTLCSCRDAGLPDFANARPALKRSKTMNSVLENIPETHEQVPSIVALPIREALKQLSQWIRHCEAETIKHLLLETHSEIGSRQSQLAIWGNGSMGSEWIKSAYGACRLHKPWKLYEEMCFRSTVWGMVGFEVGDCWGASEGILEKVKEEVPGFKAQIECLVEAAKWAAPSPALQRCQTELALRRWLRRGSEVGGRPTVVTQGTI